MVRTIKITAGIATLAGALALVTAAPASATILTLPFIGDIEHPDFDPLHVMSPAPPEAAPKAPPMKKKHHHKMKKKMMKKKM